tara:strand:- start:461 stop:718 length:258 start_codon:yes stop_codon:yes gene_type:complete
MAITKKIIVDKIETQAVAEHYNLHVRERTAIIEDGNEISSSYHRYVITPDHDVNSITDPTIKAQFQAVMTDAVKSAYETFKSENP